MKTLLIATICMAFEGYELALAFSLSSEEWMLYKSEHGKSYDSQAEDARHFASFVATKQLVERHNAQGNGSFRMELNHLADWTQEELAKMKGVMVTDRMFIEAQEKINETEAYLAKILGSSSEPVSDQFDWRKVPGRVSPVKDQGQHCASGWAFSVTGALEGQEIGRVVNKTNQVDELSAQELVDCSESNDGCAGGIASLAFDDLNQLGGIMSERDYPYEAVDGTCRLSGKRAVMKVSGHFFLTPYDETQLKRVLAKFGPISVAINAAGDLSYYRDGVISSSACTSEMRDLNHGVLLVGYGIDPKQGDYWLVKNSWGPKWGESGYFRIQRGNNLCGIASLPTIPKFQ